MQSNRITTKLFQNQLSFSTDSNSQTKTPQKSALSYSTQPVQTKSPQPILSQSTQSIQKKEDDDGDIALIKNRNKIEKTRHLESVVYLSKPPTLGLVMIYTQKTHVYLKYQAYVNQHCTSQQFLFPRYPHSY